MISSASSDDSFDPGRYSARPNDHAPPRVAGTQLAQPRMPQMSTNDRPRKPDGHHDHLLNGRESALLFTAFFALALSILSVFSI
jgi:hypothetical protein